MHLSIWIDSLPYGPVQMSTERPWYLLSRHSTSCILLSHPQLKFVPSSKTPKSFKLETCQCYQRSDLRPSSNQLWFATQVVCSTIQNLISFSFYFKRFYSLILCKLWISDAPLVAILDRQTMSALNSSSFRLQRSYIQVYRHQSSKRDNNPFRTLSIAMTLGDL